MKRIFWLLPPVALRGEKKEKKKKKKKSKSKELGWSGREGRSKKKHDKPAGCPADTLLKRKAEAAPSGAGSGGIASRLRRSVQWVDSAAPKTG